MTEPFVGEIRQFAGNFAPVGWARCEGQLMPISQNTALFSLLGTTYGGDGRSTFALPDLRGIFPRGYGQGPGLSPVALGETGGAVSVNLLSSEMPTHTHIAMGTGNAGNQNTPGNAVWGVARYGRAADHQYATTGALAPMSPSAIAPAGAGGPHNNMPPYLVVTFIIALQGVFPPHP